ncbi:MAG: ComEC/Rec2 family competence protein [Acidimicrobiia bacterium]
MSVHPAAPPRVSWPWMALAAVVWAGGAWVASHRVVPPLEAGPFEGEALLVGEVVEGRYGPWALAETTLGPVLLELDSGEGLGRGVRIRISGTITGEPGAARGRSYRAVIEVAEAEAVSAPSLYLRLGRGVRDRVISRLEPFDDGRALLAGFLIGDTSRLADTDREAMRRAGLSHFVAVSGSNVALFLGLLAFVAGPLALGPRRRAAVGLVGLPIYAAATGFEPSVLRASLMAGIALTGRLVGLVFEAWQLLALAVVGLVLYEPGITANVGFQLSVAATGGVIVGARWPLRGGRIVRALAVTAGAQIAVAPLILFHFGSVPAMSPLVNLVAGPLVAAATLLGAVGTAGLGVALAPAALMAEAVLMLARGAEGWPQLSVGPLFVAVVGLVAFWRLPALRVGLATVMAVVVFAAVIVPAKQLPDPGVVVLDVGQGDAILLHGGGGRFALVDGGPDGRVLLERLRAYGVSSLELVVVSHVHADHVTGLTALAGRMAVGQVWEAADPHSTPAYRELVASLGRLDIPVSAPEVGATYTLGDLELTVVGPLRRYASPNDQSLVVMVQGPRRTMLLSGDIEVIAQRELSYLRADVLKVPHQGSATSDPDWLRGVGADLAVIPVGPNDFGHPSPAVIGILVAAGAEVVRTDEVGDVVIPLS